MAGLETSSGAVITLLDLAQNMEAQTRLREELLEAELNSKTIENPTLDAVTRENLRLHPSSVEIHCIAIITALPVRAGDQFTIPYTLLNTNPAIWGHDAQEFVPEWWMTSDGIPPSKDLLHGP
ncbi:hypothetical protein DFS33DRAFT_1488368 [Desarmillaria ectypa]|nr:hypothetical protein DFS33DRAFT_1488368 [Desarmillaria ectypa]